MQALKHQADLKDWYVKIYETLGLKAGSRVLDLGRVYAKLWRNNWKTISGNVVIDGYDLHGSWADGFEKYVGQNSDALAEGTVVNLYFEDVENEETWDNIRCKGAYDYVIAHYLFSFLKDAEGVVQQVSKVLVPGGMFTVNSCDVSREHAFWQKMFREMKLKTDFISEKEERMEQRQEAYIAMFEKYFPKVENIKVENNMRYEESGELFEVLLAKYPDGKNICWKKKG